MCRAEDQSLYVVKTRLSGRDTLVKEWLCYRIGTRLGLPIPEARIVYMDYKAPGYSTFAEASALADCPGFGSALIKPTNVLTASQIPDVSLEERVAVLLFDWWIMNGDRQPGNPNLLWLQSHRKLHVIDHNLAFGNDDPSEFWQRHLFQSDRATMVSRKPQALPVMTDIIRDLPTLWTDIPEEWREYCTFGLDRVSKILGRCFEDSFWAI